MVDAAQTQIVQIQWEAELAIATLGIQVFSSVHVQSCIKAIYIGRISLVDERFLRQFEIFELPKVFFDRDDLQTLGIPILPKLNPNLIFHY